MATIVEYTTTRAPENRYPERIVSPPRPGACCTREAELLGPPALEGRSLYQYQRCRRCGYTVRRIQRLLPDPEAVAAIRRRLSEMTLDQTCA
jgi:hypothetical protein